MITRELHPAIWWIWAGALAIALARTNNLLFSCTTVATISFVVARKAEDAINAPWVGSFRWALRLGIWIVLIRIIVGVLIGVPTIGRTLITLPTISLPTWMAGIRVGGAVTQERVIATAREGLMLASIIVVLAAASSLTNPHRLLRSLPVVVYEFGVAVVIATTLLPQLVTTVKRIRQAQRLRGQEINGPRSWKRLAVPLLEESLSRSLDLAAAMDSRGYGMSRRRSRYRATRWEWNEYAMIALAIITFIYPLTSIFLAALPLLLAPSLRRSQVIRDSAAPVRHQ
ncbi:MAG: energy-coupling factor transporter transmembrane protein EcfT [Actinobacteria bacterium]|nr:energy-coupling factor transporter transmembrane protein EcfT [Actinomycetota bacterium]